MRSQLEQVKATQRIVDTNTERIYAAAKRRIDAHDAHLRDLRARKASEKAAHKAAQDANALKM